jgi:hypothetical protein
VLRQPEDAEGVRASFAVLALSEVARADRIQRQLGQEQRAAQVLAAITRVLGGQAASEHSSRGAAENAEEKLWPCFSPRLRASA